MKLKRMADDLEKFHSSDALTLEDVLGILQNVSRDIKKETGQSVEECTVRDADALTGLLIWMGKLYQRIYASHEGRSLHCQTPEGVSGVGSETGSADE